MAVVERDTGVASEFAGSRPAEKWHRIGRWLVARPALSLLPVLLLCAGVVLLLANDALEGDEGRYVDYARNMLQGFYTPADAINLISGPGYPFILMPLVLFDVPIMYLALSYDHRIIDGREAVTFLVRVKESLEDPQRILLEM